jgi:hypothetical protein
MPSKTEKQARFMATMAHNPKLAKERGIPVSVAREFNAHDKGSGLLAGAMKNERKK